MITNDEHQKNLVANALHREQEIYSYQLNIDNYTAALDSLPAEELPDDLRQYDGQDPNALPLSLTDEQHDLIVRCNYRNGLSRRIRAERAQMLNAVTMRDVLKAQIGADYDALVVAEKANVTP